MANSNSLSSVFLSFFIQWFSYLDKFSYLSYALICATIWSILRSWYNPVFRQTHVFPRDWKMLHFLLIIHDLSIQHTELEFGHNRDKWIRWFLSKLFELHKIIKYEHIRLKEIIFNTFDFIILKFLVQWSIGNGTKKIKMIKNI